MREIFMHLAIICMFEIDQTPKVKFDNPITTYVEQFMSPFPMDTKMNDTCLLNYFTSQLIVFA